MFFLTRVWHLFVPFILSFTKWLSTVCSHQTVLRRTGQFTVIATQTDVQLCTWAGRYSQGKHPEIVFMKIVFQQLEVYSVSWRRGSCFFNLHKGTWGQAAAWLVHPDTCARRGSNTQEVVRPAWRRSAEVSQRKLLWAEKHEGGTGERIQINGNDSKGREAEMRAVGRQEAPGGEPQEISLQMDGDTAKKGHLYLSCQALLCRWGTADGWRGCSKTCQEASPTDSKAKSWDPHNKSGSKGWLLKYLR